MRFQGSDGSSFELNILGYQFPHLETEPYDSNWLMVEIKVNHPNHSWTASAPCLLTYDLLQLADWLKHIMAGGLPNPIVFIEPELEFRYIQNASGKYVLQGSLRYNFSPTWSPDQRHKDEGWQIDFPLDEIDIEEAIKSLTIQYNKFPQRASK